MNDQVNTVAIQIMGRTYQIKCPSDKIEELHASALHLEKKVSELKEQNKMLDTERLLLIAALNISHELIRSQQEKQHHSGDFQERIQKLQDKIELALSE
jgi:cell division protein ZapA